MSFLLIFIVVIMSWSAKMAKFQLQYLSVGNGNTVFVVEVVFQ